MSNPLKIEFEDYNPDHIVDGEPFSLKVKGGGWRNPEEVIEHVTAALQHVLSTLKEGDKLTITISVE